MAASQPGKSAEQAAHGSKRAASLMSPGPDCARSSSLTSLRHSLAALGNPTGALNLTQGLALRRHLRPMSKKDPGRGLAHCAHEAVDGQR